MKTPKTPLHHKPDPDHHIWKNGNLYWLAATVHRSNWTKDRIRVSLGTSDVQKARIRRDDRLAEIAAEPGTSLALRFSKATDSPMKMEGMRHA